MSKSGSVPEFRDSVEAAVYTFGGHKIVQDVVKKAMRSAERRYEKDPCEFVIKGRFKRFDVIEFDFGLGKERGIVNHQTFEDRYMTKPLWGVIRFLKINGESTPYLDEIKDERLRKAKIIYRVDVKKLKKEEEMRKKAEEVAKNDNA